MEKMIGYIFGNIELHDKAIVAIAQALKSQSKINKTTKAFMLATTAYIVVSDMQRREDQKKIDALTKEIKELKEVKGE